jgi:hypothetical protein
METRHEIARKYGYRLRSTPDAFFLSEIKSDPRAASDDLMRIGNDGDITVYAHDASAFFVANLVRNTLK